ncbi:MAG: hypothetical protein FWE76_01655 [Symbiobacteriaceae bacterium]|nr:hypothetical protein [Symbiobacteriaceae bacterium]
MILYFQPLYYLTWRKLDLPYSIIPLCDNAHDTDTILTEVVYNNGNLKVIAMPNDVEIDLMAGLNIAIHMIIGNDCFYLGATTKYDGMNTETWSDAMKLLWFQPITDSIYRFTSFIGANAMNTVFIWLDNGVPVISPAVGGHLFYRRELASNSALEYVLCTGIPPKTEIYHISRDEIYIADLSRLMQPHIAYYTEQTDLFQKYDGSHTKHYKLVGKYFLVRVPGEMHP